MSKEHVIDAKVRADTTSFHKGMADVDRDLDKAGKGFSKYGAEADKASAQAQSFVEANGEYMELLGKEAAIAGGAVVASLGLAAKAAMDWESAWAGVTKTVDGSPAQMDELEESLRGLAKTLPVTHAEIAGVAEAAGQLGVAREDITKFTKTMIDLGETTNLTADEAATSIAQISNVMGTAGDDVDNFGSTLVALGNDGASTEAEILEMAKRIAGAAKLVGASESDVLALANSMASVGIEAQLGGGVVSRVMQRMYEDVMDGGDALENLARVAGVSGKDFAEAFEKDPVRAVDMMVKGLGRVKDEGGNVVKTMSDLGIEGTEETGVILRLAGAGTLLADSLKLGDQAWKSNSALALEASKRYETTESKVKIAWNGIQDAAIDAGAVLLPVIRGVAEAVSGLTSAFGDLSSADQGTIVTFAGMAGGALLLGGILLTTIPRVIETVVAVRALATASPAAAAALGALGRAALPVAAALTALMIGKRINESLLPAKKSAEDLTAALIALGDGTKTISQALGSETFARANNGLFGLKEVFGLKLAEDIDSAGAALHRLGDLSWSDTVNDFMNSGPINLGGKLSELRTTIKGIDEGLSGLVTSGSFELASSGFKKIAEDSKAHGVSLEKTAESFPQYMASLKRLANEAKVQLTDQELLNWALGEVPAKMTAAAESTEGQARAAEQAAQATEQQQKALDDLGISVSGAILELDKLVTSMIASGLISLSAKDAARAFEAAIDGLDESLKTNGTTLDTTTEKGRANEAAFDAIAGAGLRSAEAMAKNGESQEAVQGNLRRTYDELIVAAGKFGITGDAADDMARDVLKIPKGVSIDTAIQNYADTMAKLLNVNAKADAMNGKRVNIGIYTTEYFDTLDRRSAPTQVDPGKLGGRYAAGGALDSAPGPKGVDSKLFWGAKGEHVLTDEDVDAMGGQAAVYAFRKQLHKGGGPQLQYATPAPPAPVMSVMSSGGDMQMTGTLILDSGEVMGTFRGIARQEAGAAIGAANDDLWRGRAR